MANLIDNISIKNKIIFGLLFTLFMSMGIGILQFNKIIKIQNSYSARKVLTSYRSDFVKLQNIYFKLDAIVVKLANSKIIDDFIKTSNDYKSLDLEISNVFSDLEIIDISKIRDDETIEFLTGFNDSLFKFQSLYNDNIKLSVEKLIDYQYLIFHPEKIKSDYKRLVAEQQSVGVILTNIDDQTSSNEDVINELLVIYQNSIIDLSTFISQIIKSQTFSLDKINYNIQEEISNDELLIATVREDSIRVSGIILFLGIILILVLSFLISNNVIKPLTETNEIIDSLAKGDFPSISNIERADEIGIMLESLAALIQHLKETSQFAKEISGSNFEYKFSLSSEKDLLGNSLIQLRESLLNAKQEEDNRKQEDYRRSRIADGLAKFSEILRQNQNNLRKLGSEVISSLVKFLNSNQGVIFILNDDDENNVYIELLAAYAWNREKFIEKRLQIGEGLIGGVAVEKFTVYMTDVPEDYIEIKSGTGAANPSSILIVPLKVDDEVLGVVELASFQSFDKYEIELVEKIAESIASTLKSVRITAQTADLLEKFQIQAAEMKEQETAMRTTIDDLKKNQDERRRNEESLRVKVREMEELNKQIQYKEDQQKLEIEKLIKENNKKVKQIEQNQKQNREILHSMMTAVLIIKQGGHIDFVNKAAEELWGYNEMEMLGVNVEKLLLSPPDMGEKKLCEYLFENISKIQATHGRDFYIQLNEGKPKKVVLEVMVLEGEKEEEMRMVIFLKDLTKFEKRDDNTKQFIADLVKKDFQNTMKLESYDEFLAKNNIEIPSIDIDTKELIKWSSKLELGISIIDNQHKRWIEFINNLYEALVTNQPEEKMQGVFKKLLDYTEYHFGFEEKYMSEFNYPDMDAHNLGHEKFVHSVIELFTDFIEGKSDTIYNLIVLLKTWVYDHVALTDRKYVELFKKHGIR
ncbi:MAG: bacteriohemerythrin [Bacteroidales bacterium]|nr:bacteriohemerythrin [Bacteroidales bacterium]